jgi:glycine oxidase
MTNYDYIIAGQGLAGTVLAYTLLREGRSVLIIDDNDPAAASKVAAGIYNPIVPKRLAKSWRADELLPVMHEFYPSIEKLLHGTFFHTKRMIKPFTQEQEKLHWLKKAGEDMGEYLSTEIFMDDMEGMIESPLGFSEILGTGNLDTITFLEGSRWYFKKLGILLEERFDHRLLALKEEDEAVYKDYHAGKVIFCEGHRAAENPYFSFADYRLTKGEVLIIKLPEDRSIAQDFIINKGVFVLPLENNTYKVGATFDWQDMTQEPTTKARLELAEKLRKVLKIPFEIVDQQAGIRPTINDRRPVIGLHPEHSMLGIFNGLGTKGVMLAPYFAKHFSGFLQGRHPLDPEVDVLRFKS